MYLGDKGLIADSVFGANLRATHDSKVYASPKTKIKLVLRHC